MRFNIILALSMSLFLAGCNGKSQKRENIRGGSAANPQTRSQQEADALRIQQEADALAAQRAQNEDGSQRTNNADSISHQASDATRNQIQNTSNVDDSHGPAEPISVTVGGMGMSSISGGASTVVAPESVGEPVAISIGSSPDITDGSTSIPVVSISGAATSNTTSEVEASTITAAQREAIITGLHANNLWESFATATETSTAPANLFGAADACAGANKIFSIAIDRAKFKSIIQLLQAQGVTGESDIYLAASAPAAAAAAAPSDASQIMSVQELRQRAINTAETSAKNFWKSSLVSLYVRTAAMESNARAELTHIAAGMGMTLEANSLLPNVSTSSAAKMFVKINIQHKPGNSCVDMGSDLSAMAISDTSTGFKDIIQQTIERANTDRAAANRFGASHYLYFAAKREVFVKVLKADNSVIFSQNGAFESRQASLVMTGAVAAAQIQSATVAQMGIFARQFFKGNLSLNHFTQKSLNGSDIQGNDREMLNISTRYAGETMKFSVAGEAANRFLSLAIPVQGRGNGITLNATQLGRQALTTAFSSDLRIRISTSTTSMADLSAMTDQVDAALN